jgi:hypothetical protein
VRMFLKLLQWCTQLALAPLILPTCLMHVHGSSREVHDSCDTRPEQLLPIFAACITDAHEGNADQP